MENIFLYVSLGLLFFVIVGFLIGFARSWKRSLVRFGINLGVLIVSLFITPAISNIIIDKFAQGTSLNAFGFNINFDVILGDMVGEEVMADLAGAEATTSKLLISLMHIIINIALFIFVFIAISMLALIIYWIVSAIVRHSNKKAIREGRKERKKDKWWLKLIGGAVGMVTMVVIFFAFLTPIFGIMNICNKFVETESANAASAVSVSGKNTLGGRLYYTDNDKIGKVETYLETYDDLKGVYDKSPAGAVFNALGISKLGGIAFGYLTTVEHDGLTVDLTDEIVVISSAYNTYREAFVEKTFDITNNASIEGVQRIYNIVQDSKIVRAYLRDLLPVMAEKWGNDQPFLGIELPVEENLKGITKALLAIFASEDIDRVSANVNVVFDLVKVMNKDEAIEKIINEKMSVMDYLDWCIEQNNIEDQKPESERKEYKKLIYDVMITLSTTKEFKENLPKIFNEVIKMLYVEMGGDAQAFDENVLTNEEIAKIVYDKEAKNLQGITERLLIILKAMDEAGEDNDVLTDNIVEIGGVIDLARESVMLSKPLQTLVVEFINSADIDDGLKDSLLGLIKGENSKWNDQNFKFASTFKIMVDTADLLKELQEGELNAETLEKLLSENFGTFDSETISDLLKSLGGEDFDVKNIQKDAEAFKELFGLYKDSNSDDGLNLGGSEEEKAERAQEIIDHLNDSEAFNDLLEKAEGISDIQDILDEMIGNLSNSDDFEYLKDAVKESGNDLLKSLFGL